MSARKPNAYGLTGRMRDVRGLPNDGISGKPVRIIPVTPLGHSADCCICAAVDRWAANRKQLRASAGRITTGGGAPRFGPAGLVRPADSRERIPGLRRSG